LGFVVVCSFSTLKSRAVFTSLSIQLIQKDISPLNGKKITENGYQIQSVDLKEEKKRFGGLGYILNG